MNDPIVEAVRQARAEHAEAFDYDLRAIFADVCQKQQASGRDVVSFPARRLPDTGLAEAGIKAPSLQE